jgi:hypothetical protein
MDEPSQLLQKIYKKLGIQDENDETIVGKRRLWFELVQQINATMSQRSHNKKEKREGFGYYKNLLVDLVNSIDNYDSKSEEKLEGIFLDIADSKNYISMKEKIETIYKDAVLESIGQNIVYRVCPVFTKMTFRNKYLVEQARASKQNSQSYKYHI